MQIFFGHCHLVTASAVHGSHIRRPVKTAHFFQRARHEAQHTHTHTHMEPLWWCRHSCKRKLADLSEATPSAVPGQPHALLPQQPFQASPRTIQGAAQQAGPAEMSGAVHQHPHSSAKQHTTRAPLGQTCSTQAQQRGSRKGTGGKLGVSSQLEHGLTAHGLQPGQESAVPGVCPSQEEDGLVPPEGSQQAAARHLRHCTSLHSVAEAAEQSQNRQVHSSPRSDGCQAPQHVWHGGQRAQHAQAESLNAQNVEACVASSRWLEQPTASTGTSRPVPLGHVG